MRYGGERSKKMRKAGILMPLASLPSPYGIGTIGQEARRFVDFLYDTDQSYWQVLPLNPTSYGDSPYQSPSAFAGNPYYIDLPTLHEDGLLNAKELKAAEHDTLRIDYYYMFVRLFRDSIPLTPITWRSLTKTLLG